jgi:hypothetical protein
MAAPQVGATASRTRAITERDIVLDGLALVWTEPV